MRQPVGPHALDHRQVIDAFGDFRIPIADPNARLSMRRNLRCDAISGVWAVLPIAVTGRLKLRRQRLAGEFGEHWLRIEQIEMARPAVHEAPDHAFGLGGKRRGLGRQRIFRRRRAAAAAIGVDGPTATIAPSRRIRRRLASENRAANWLARVRNRGLSGRKLGTTQSTYKNSLELINA